MKKAIRILSIICLALMIFSLVVTVACIILQKPLIDLFYGKSVADAPVAVPVGTVVYVLCATVALGLLCPVAANRKIGVWADLILLGVNILALPGLNRALSFAQTTLNNSFFSTYGSAAVVANSAVSSMCSFTMIPGGLGMRLALVVCGMSIVFKLLEKRQTVAL